MGRTLQDVMSERNISRYHLSKISGIPWATLSDICSGKTALERCSAGTVLKLSRALGMTMEETMDLETSGDRGCVHHTRRPQRQGLSRKGPS